MPPKVRFTREEIIRAALDITRESGPEALTARSLAARLDCSAKPIFGLFRSMDEVQQEVLKAGYQFYGEAIARAMESGEYPPYKASGMAYIDFARREKHLFRLLFMRNRSREEVTRQLVRLQQQSQRRTPVFDRPSQNGDELVLDYTGFADGQQFAGGTAEKQTLVLGSGTFIPGFEEQLVGKNPGDDVTVHVTFPAQYHAPELAGKDAEFRCHIHEIRTVAPYALDDTFAKEVGECETMDEMRQKMRTSLEDYYAERAEMELRERLLRQAAATMDFTPDPAEISKAVEEQLDTMSAQLAQKNLTLEDYCKFTNSTLDQMREDARPGAEQAVRIKALVRKVAQLEDLHAAEEDVAQALSEICRANHMTMEELQPYYDDAFAAAVEYSILLAKVTKLIRTSAVLED